MARCSSSRGMEGRRRVVAAFSQRGALLIDRPPATWSAHGNPRHTPRSGLTPTALLAHQSQGALVSRAGFGAGDSHSAGTPLLYEFGSKRLLGRQRRAALIADGSRLYLTATLTPPSGKVPSRRGGLPPTKADSSYDPADGACLSEPYTGTTAAHIVTAPHCLPNGKGARTHGRRTFRLSFRQRGYSYDPSHGPPLLDSHGPIPRLKQLSRVLSLSSHVLPNGKQDASTLPERC
jgi:hypothetical protein